MKVGIFFGGSSREREVSFAGGRTVYDNLDKSLFEAIPIFVDSFNNFILLDWKYIYKGSIRDFYPTVSDLKKSKHAVQIYTDSLIAAYKDNGLSIAQKLGKVIPPNELHKYIDFAFLALHGTFGEDGSIQGLLEWLKIPYSGSGVLPSAIGMNKRMQKQWMKSAGMHVPETYSFTKKQWLEGDRKKIFQSAKKIFTSQCVVKPANQGSSVGVSVVKLDDFASFEKAVDKSFFIHSLDTTQWKKWTYDYQVQYIQQLTDVKEGIALPCSNNGSILYHPDELFQLFNTNSGIVVLHGLHSETECLIETFITGREFSCIVLRNEDGTAVALPPTEIVKGTEVYDYRSKYLPGLSRKVTPINLPQSAIEKIRKSCVELFKYFHFHVYARIDGFYDKNGNIFLNDPNTTSGMMPSSFFFHQAAEIGLNPSQFLTYIIRTSLAERANSWMNHSDTLALMTTLDKEIANNKKQKVSRKRVAVMMGGYSTERHISVESGRNIFEKLASSVKYDPFPVFVTGNDSKHELYLMPINVMLKDNADDIREKVLDYKRAPIIDKIIEECKPILLKYGNAQALAKPYKITYNQLAKKADAVFIALHGRPGEDGTVQKELDRLGIPYNGSGSASSQITINKYDTNEILRKNGLLVADHMLVYRDDWKKNAKQVIAHVEKIGYPLIAKPADDGCSSAVKKIKNRSELEYYAEGVFRSAELLNATMLKNLQLKPKEEFPRKSFFLIEKFIDRLGATHFLEITGGMLTHYKNNKLSYETFEPSEALSEGEILSLEEKFLAGQGQNITPARYAKQPALQKSISKQVQEVLQKGAAILGVEGYCRIDAFVRILPKNSVEVVFIEVNSLPGMTPATAIFHQCALNGYKPYEFIDKILTFGEERMKRMQRGKS